MKTWLVKELSQLVNVSVKTLHHYDKVGLLKPKIRQDNNYRVYSEKDLLRLQQIIALKFFGFNLKQIALLLEQEKPVIKQFSLQAKMLKEKAEALLNASQIINNLVDECKHDESITWEKTCKLIEVFQMTQQLEHSWVKNIYSDKELKQYAEFEAKMKVGTNAHSKAEFEQRWQALIKELNNSMEYAPDSAEAISIAEKVMCWVNEVYGKEYAHLRTKKMEQGFGEGMGLEDVGFTKASVKWLSQAMDAYWAERIYNCLGQIKTKTNTELLAQWQKIMDDMYGNEEARKIEVIYRILEDQRTDDAAKVWLKTLL